MDKYLTTTLGIFIITQIIVTVWWASKVNTLLDVVQKELTELIGEFKAMKEVYVRKEDYILCQKRCDKMWEKIDRIEQIT